MCENTEKNINWCQEQCEDWGALGFPTWYDCVENCTYSCCDGEPQGGDPLWGDCCPGITYCDITCQGEKWKLYRGEPFYKEEESCHLIQFFSVDHLGNREEMNWQCVFVEDTPPTIYKDILGPKHDCTPDEAAMYGNPDYGCHYITQDTIIKLNCVD